MKYILFSISVLLLFSSNIFGQQAKANNELSALINQSFSYFPKVKEIENTMVAAEQKVMLTQINVPVIAGDANFSYVKPKVAIPFNGGEFQLAPVYNGNMNLNASYMLFDFGRLKANIKRAKDDVKYAGDNTEHVKSQLASQVADIYYSIIYLKKAITIQDSVINYLNVNKQIVESKLKNGDALKIDLLNIQVNIDAAQNTKLDIQSSLQKQINLLEYTTGSNTLGEGMAFDFDVNVLDADAALLEAKANNKEYVLAKDKIQQAQSDVAVAKLGDMPSINLQGAAGFKNGYAPEINTPKFNYNAGVGIHVPIFNGGKVKQQTILLQNIVKQNELALESLNSTYYKDIKQALNDITTNIERIRNTAAQIQQAKDAQVLATSRFKNGVGTNLEITNAGTNLQRAELNRLEHEYHLCAAKLNLARLMGYKYW